ncbi:hypothetical protein GOQ27_15185 [Clostridium sp. D2Q-11]|uniref:Uncharacterized protein n=2 Tax=Anaeromonas frigoriresistens TaxID=2683708 RepID=A0A942V295_9FIRM|nr:hypothetical protein [Anaeromonas frigoriresistens]
MNGGGNIKSIKLNKLKDKFLELLCIYIEDFFILVGLLFIIIPTYIVNIIIGLYVTGLIFIMLGIYFARNPLKKER